MDSSPDHRAAESAAGASACLRSTWRSLVNSNASFSGLEIVAFGGGEISVRFSVFLEDKSIRESSRGYCEWTLEENQSFNWQTVNYLQVDFG